VISGLLARLIDGMAAIETPIRDRQWEIGFSRTIHAMACSQPNQAPGGLGKNPVIAGENQGPPGKRLIPKDW
jgi:hypothetical protein